MTGASFKEASVGDSPARQVTVAGIVFSTVTAVLAMWLGPAGGAGAASNLGSLKPVRCAPTATDPPLEAPLYAQRDGASGKADAWWCQLPHATQVPGGLVPLRRDVAPLPNNYAIDETVYSAAGQARDASIGSNGSDAIIVEVKVNSSIAPGTTARVPQFSSARTVLLKKGVTGNVLTGSGQADVSWAYPTAGVPKYLNAVSSVTVAGFGVPASVVIAVAKHIEPN